ncbi:MAG: tRNA 2-thiouridine(34) synthase MnmA [Anaerolineae bacterium]|nr:tRNA 2-thiouridine(34) synthase MnmA [Anaerolineae bacterium]
MSGGVDSSTAAALLVEQGYDVIGLMLRLWSEVEPGVESTNRCCTPEAVEEARAVAHHLGIPFYLINAEGQFRREVVDCFIEEYSRGRTPNPCVVCNRRVRFGFLLDYALMLGAERLATGHYARVRRSATGLFQLWRGADREKDQSYMLHALDQQQLARALFPLGELTKAEVRQLAAERGLRVADRPESQDLCFVSDGDYRRFLSRWAPETARPGPIVDRKGRRLGTHRGLAFYTVGQRRGLGIAAPEPLYVVELRPAENAVVVGTAAELGRSHLTASPMHWIEGRPESDCLRAEVQIRYRASPVPASITVDGDRVHVTLDRPLRDITPGQSAVLYQGDRCLGGGPIESGDAGEHSADGEPAPS